jgi:TonB family protein
VNVTVLTQEMMASEDRTRRTIVISLIIHVLLFAWLSVYRHIAPGPPRLVEITFLEPEIAAPPPAPVIKARQRVDRPKPEPMPRSREQKFVREMPRAEVEPRPQVPQAINDALSQQLQSKTPVSALGRPDLASAKAPTSSFRSSPAKVTDARRPSSDLVRSGESATKNPSSLVRDSAPRRSAPNLATTTPTRPSSLDPSTISSAEQTRQRSLGGATLSGQIVDRPVLEYPLPAYPDWARRDAIEASVTLYFVVLPDGRVKQNVLVQKTSGYSEFDRNAVDALRRWLFEKADKGNTSEQWGTITFHFKLRDAKS